MQALVELHFLYSLCFLVFNAKVLGFNATDFLHFNDVVQALPVTLLDGSINFHYQLSIRLLSFQVLANLL